MLAEIKSGLTSAKMSIELVKAIKGVRDKADIDAFLSDIRDHMAELQQRLLETQQVADTILEKRRQALKDLEEERSKNRDLERYNLVEPRTGVFLYSFRPSEDDDTPAHTACPNCFRDKSISILQQLDPSKGWKVQCPNCDFTYDPRTKEERDAIAAKDDAVIASRPDRAIRF